MRCAVHERSIRSFIAAQTNTGYSAASVLVVVLLRPVVLKLETVVLVVIPVVVREDLQGGTRRGLLLVFLHKKYIHSCSYYLSVCVNKFLNFCVAYFPCYFLKTMAIKISHTAILFTLHLCQFWFSRLLIEWYLAHWHFLEQGGTWWQYRTHKWYAIRKTLRTTV